MDERFQKVEHSQSALYLMKEYKLKSGKNGYDQNGNLSNGVHMNGDAKKYQFDESLEVGFNYDFHY
jgi:hypothetical protein